MTRLMLLSLLPLLACADGGWRYDDFDGPGFSEETGLSADYSEDDTFIMAGTWIEVTREGNSVFAEHIDNIKQELWADPEGLVGYAFASKLTGRQHRTVTVWEDLDAMYAFVNGPAHAAAMSDYPLISSPEAPTITLSWEITGADLPPDWAAIVERVDAEGEGY